MSGWYRHLLRPALFVQDAEAAHHRALGALNWCSRHESACGVVEALFGAPALPVEVFGLKFSNPVGLAAGMDKGAAAVPIWPRLGFGFAELGAATWHPQPGNPQPRLFRAIRHEAIINRMGFNNPGAERLAKTLGEWRAAGRWPNHPVGINLGKSKITPLDKAPEDYAASFRALRVHADFFVVNVSSPNTPNLRQLQERAALDGILSAIQNVRAESPGTEQRPILIKVAPDLSFEALDEILDLAKARSLAGIIATNTTVTRPQTSDHRLARIYAEAGGLSGRPLQGRSTEVIRHLYRQGRGTIPIIGVGGIFDAAGAWEKITAGASLVQLYTALVFEGPGVVSTIVRGLARRVEEAGFKSLSDAVGTAVR